MKTDNVYICMLNVVTRVKRGKDTGFRLYNIPLHDRIITFKPLNPVLVLYEAKKDGENVVKDLNTKEQYSFVLPTEVGKIFVNAESLFQFNRITGNPKKSLSKRKILKIGNQTINEIIKKLEEKKK